MSESEFINPEKWKNINRGYFYQAAMYYLSNTEQPLRFLEFNDEENSYKIVQRYGDFSPVKVEGRKRAVEQDIVITLKPRQVILISNDRINQNKDFEYVQVLPVFGLTYQDSNRPWYQDLKNDNHIGFAYLPRGTSHGVAVDLTQVSTIHKSLLLKKQSKVPEDRLEFIESHLLELLDL